MRATPVCSRKVQEELLQLRQKEELELLRAPLIEYRIFPSAKNPNTAPITAEDLKKLVRHWKLHETRAFWKNHPQKEDLVRALLDYMATREDSLGFPSTPTQPTPPQSPRPSKSRPRGELLRTALATFEKFDIGLKEYKGDVFGKTECTAGMVYLSRVQNKGEISLDVVSGEEKSTGLAGSRRPPKLTLMRSMGTAKDVGEHRLRTNSAGEPETPRTPTTPAHKAHGDVGGASGISESAREASKALSVVMQLYKFSHIPENEANMLDEQAVPALRELCRREDPRLQAYVVATLLNLAVEPAAVERILGAGLVSDTARLVMNTTGDLQLACAALLFRLSSESGTEDMLVSAGLHAATVFSAPEAVVSDSNLAMKVAVAAMANLSVADEKEAIMDKVKACCQSLVKATDMEAWLVVVAALHNLTMQDSVLPVLVDSGVVVIFREICIVGLRKLDSPPDPVRLTLLYAAMAQALRNLSCCVDARRMMIKDGAVKILARVVESAPAQAVQESCALALMHLTMPGTGASTGSVHAQLQELVVSNGGIDSLVSLAASVQSDEAMLHVTTALYALSMTKANLERMVQKQVHAALMDLIEKAKVDASRSVRPPSALGRSIPSRPHHSRGAPSSGRSAHSESPRHSAHTQNQQHQQYAGAPQAHVPVGVTIREYAISGLCNLLRVKANQLPMVNHGVATLMGSIIEATQHRNEKVLGVKTLSNLTPSLESYTMDTHSTMLKAMSLVATDEDSEIQAICASAFASFSTFSNEGVIKEMIRFQVPRRLFDLIQGNDPRVQFQCAATFDSLARHDAVHQDLYELECLKTLLQLAGSTAQNTLYRCASAVKSLSRSPLDRQGLIAAVAALQRSTQDQPILRVAAEAMFILSCDLECRGILATHSVILRQLFAIMRGGIPETQLCGTRALCNFSRDPLCAKTLLDAAIVDDFIVIAILRTNNEMEDVKAVCAESLFNLLHNPEYRQRMVDKDVLWAVIKLSRIDSPYTQKVAMRVLYNLSCDPDSRKTVMDLGLAHVLAVLSKQRRPEARRWAAATLCNLSEVPEFAQALGNEGAVSVLRDSSLLFHIPPDGLTGADGIAKGAAAAPGSATHGAAAPSAAPTGPGSSGTWGSHRTPLAPRTSSVSSVTRMLYRASMSSPETRRKIVSDGADVLLSTVLQAAVDGLAFFGADGRKSGGGAHAGGGSGAGEVAAGDDLEWSTIRTLGLLGLYNLTCEPSCLVTLSDHKAPATLLRVLRQLHGEVEHGSAAARDLSLVALAAMHKLCVDDVSTEQVTSAGSLWAVTSYAGVSAQHAEVCGKLCVRMAATVRNHERLVTDGAVHALDVLAMPPTGADSPPAWQEALDCLGRLSETADISAQLVTTGALPLLAKFLGLAQRVESLASRSSKRRLTAAILRNLTCTTESLAQVTAIAEAGAVEQQRDEVVLEGLFMPLALERPAGEDESGEVSEGGSRNSASPRYHACAAMYNIVFGSTVTPLLLKKCQPLLTRVYREAQGAALKKLCGLCLVHAQSANRDDEYYTQGSVLALCESLDLANLKEDGPGAEEPVAKKVNQNISRGPVPPPVGEPAEPTAEFIVVTASRFVGLQGGPDAGLRALLDDRIPETALWESFEQKITHIEDSELANLTTPDSHQCPPPQLPHSHAAGQYLKLSMIPAKVRISVGLGDAPLEEHGDASGEDAGSAAVKSTLAGLRTSRSVDAAPLGNGETHLELDFHIDAAKLKVKSEG